MATKWRFGCIFVMFLLGLSGLGQASAETPYQLYFKSGQMFDQVVRVYVEGDLTGARDFKLCLLSFSPEEEQSSGSAEDDWSRCEKSHVPPLQVFHDQLIPAGGSGLPEASKMGTLMLFDLQKLEPNQGLAYFKTVTRIWPILQWQKGDETIQTATDGRRYLGMRWMGLVWALLISAVVVGLIVWLIGRNDQGLIGLVSTRGGVMSVALTQMALWTFAIGVMSLWFGLIQLDVPDLPHTLVMLMGLSVGTTAVGQWQSRRIKTEGVIQQDGPKLSDLMHITTPGAKGGRAVSLAQGQILFWTVITLALFIVKSFVDGALWEVPEEMVMLMGLSQGGYLARMQVAVSDSVGNDSTGP